MDSIEEDGAKKFILEEEENEMEEKVEVTVTDKKTIKQIRNGNAY